MRSFIQKSILVVALMTMLDVVFAIYVLQTAQKHAVLAGLFAGFIIVLSGFVTRAYVGDKRLLWPAAAGAFIGTYLAVTLF